MGNRKRTGPLLVPVDFSQHSEAALVWAGEMAACMDTELLLLHVVHDPGDAPGYYAVKGHKKQLRRMEDIAAEMLDQFQDGVARKHASLTKLQSAQKRLVVGLPVNRILEVVRKVQPSMVVMGSQGRTGLGHLLLGSKAEQVVQLCPVPVTIVKASKR